MRLLLAAVLASTLTTIACGDSPIGASGTGASFRLMLTDSPFSDAKAVLVTFSEVTVHRDPETEFTRVPFSGGATTRTCDLKKLEGPQDVLGVGTLVSGHYTQVRLVVSSATIYFDNPSSGSACAASIPAPSGSSAPLEIPSGEVKLNRQFDVPTSGTTTMVLDFDGDASIHETGNGRYMMRPVITVLSVQ